MLVWQIMIESGCSVVLMALGGLPVAGDRLLLVLCRSLIRIILASSGSSNLLEHLILFNDTSGSLHPLLLSVCSAISLRSTLLWSSHPKSRSTPLRDRASEFRANHTSDVLVYGQEAV